VRTGPPALVRAPAQHRPGQDHRPRQVGPGRRPASRAANTRTPRRSTLFFSLPRPFSAPSASEAGLARPVHLRASWSPPQQCRVADREHAPVAVGAQRSAAPIGHAAAGALDHWHQRRQSQTFISASAITSIWPIANSRTRSNHRRTSCDRRRPAVSAARQIVAKHVWTGA